MQTHQRLSQQRKMSSAVKDWSELDQDNETRCRRDDEPTL